MHWTTNVLYRTPCMQYRHLDNVVLTITPKAARGAKALLIASHYDSPVCSYGA